MANHEAELRVEETVIQQDGALAGTSATRSVTIPEEARHGSSPSSSARVTPRQSPRNSETRFPEWHLNFKKYSMFRKAEDDLRKYPKRTRDFYREQNETIGFIEEASLDTEGDVEEGGGGARDEPPESEALARAATRLSFIFNVMLFIGKSYVVVASGSLSVIASAIDSFLDLFSGLVLFLSARAATRQGDHKYPAGKARMEPVGVIVFASVMGMVSLNVMFEGARRLIGRSNEDLSLSVLDLSLLGAVIATKFCLWLWCRRFAHLSTAVDAQSQDHRNDVFTNIVGTVAAVLGSRVAWWIDPLGAMLFSAYIIFNWTRTGWENIRLIVGMTAPPSFLRQLTVTAWNHHPAVQLIDTVRAFHFGSRYIVELDIVLPPETPLRESHDIGESLQYKLERLPDVERAFVHIDFESSHRPEHGGVPPSSPPA